MINDNYAKRFLELKPKYEKLGVNVKQALEALLQEKDIPYLSINYRVKEQNSFLEKIERKKYEQPFLETEDLCGIRIICYFQNDIDKIQNIINSEFKVTENQIKQELLNATEFGYRSTHLIAQVKKEWASTPAFRGIVDLKFEIQVRTILMHSWAEIEHKLAYKSESEIPKELRRQFSFISAALENADFQFEVIKNAIQDNNSKLISKAEEENKFDDSIELNLDNLQAFFDYAFKGRNKNIDQTRGILNEMITYNITFPQLINGHIEFKSILPRIEKDIISKLSSEQLEIIFGKDKELPDILWNQAGIARVIFALINQKYRSNNYFLDQKIIDKYTAK